MSRRTTAAVAATYVLLTITVFEIADHAGFWPAVIATIAIALAGLCNYLLGWFARDRQQPLFDPLREQMRVTPRPVPLEQRHIDALLAFGENCFGPMELDDDHDEALDILRASRVIPIRDGE